MRKYAGQSLEVLEDEELEPLLTTLEHLVPGRKYDIPFDFRAWRFWEFGSINGRPAFVLLEANTSPHPGSTRIRLTLFDTSPDPPFVAEFTTGYRCYLSGATIEANQKLTHPLVVLETAGRGGPGPAYYKQFYAWNGKRFDLVRVEDWEGGATRNDYADKPWQCGPPIPQQSEAEWEEDLLSRDRHRVLRALVWLGGTHLSPKAVVDVRDRYERLDEVHLVNEVRRRDKVTARLAELARSDYDWFREGAELALKPDDYSR
jgi:hypothetical protein